MRETGKTMLRSLGRALGVLALCSFATVSTTFAESISKTFEFGAGTSQPRSHVRTFPIPCGTEGGVAAVVKFRRLGADGAGNDIPIIIELREPDTAPGQEGPVVETKTATGKRAEETVILRSQSSNRGCSLPWRVRVRYANEGPAPVQVFGTIRLDFDGRTRSIDVNGEHTINKGRSVTVRLEDSGGFEQGKIEIVPNFVHDVLGFPGPNPVKLRFELNDPSGAVVKTAEGYANRNEHREQGLPILKLIYQVADRVPGQWKLKMTNLDSNDDARIVNYFANFTPGCPN